MYFQETEEIAKQTSHDNGLWDFLRKRGVAEENIDRMQQDKVRLIPLFMARTQILALLTLLAINKFLGQI